ncbi:alpha/beta hydrolase-fold protein [uncultured Draconibacterium sp.]|uniref:alpha/beta hydrolase-fold protein n=1 Tax=uncultured Draconibacterium sp. TaxID=1573823 RepID=UPI0029C78586|nr:alpha/beta hydrolase-fold protein [uncultured Draconibacterium sp.]
MKHFLLILMIIAQASMFCLGQENQKSVPATSNVAGAEYPKIQTDLSVIFRVKAPDAKKVQIDLGKLYDMTKDDQGVWSVTTDPQVPGFHYYSLVIDGVKVADPASESFYGMGRMASAIEIPEKGIDFYTIKDVPHGALSSKYYYSEYTKSWRRLFVYTPPGYDTNSREKYPVVYIQHGGGEDETGWAVQGKTDIILDNLIAEGKAKPMIVVISNGNVTAPGRTFGGYSSKGMAPFKEEMTKNIVPFIDTNYRTLPDADNRAICGLSMGGGQSFFVGLESPEYFGSVGVFSTGLFGGIRTSGSGFDAEKEIPGLLSESDKFNKNLDLFYISCGEQDMRIEHTKKAVKVMRENGLEVEFNSFPGDHEWQVWRKSLHDFATRVFK